SPLLPSTTLFRPDRERHVVEAGTAIGVGHQDPKQSQSGGLVDQVARELAVVVDRLGARLDLTLGEFPRERAHLLLFGAEGKIHLSHTDDGRLALCHPGADAGRAVAAAPMAE